jgi:hypothetical protein
MCLDRHMAYGGMTMFGRSKAAISRVDTAHSSSVEDQLNRVHWHILRADSLRGSVAARAGTLLSTNALVIAGVALALGWTSHRPGATVISSTVLTFTCVSFSVTNAALATMTVFRWRPQIPDEGVWRGSIYSFVSHGSGADTFEEFKRQRATESPKQVLDEALRELWENAQLHRRRYRRLRNALRWLLAGLACLFITVVLSIV